MRTWLALFVAAMLTLLSGCGTPYATTRSPAGDEVMLLGYDPVAYFTQGKPMRGDKRHKVDLPQRSYYFANADHKRSFEADPKRYEPQYGGFCSSGAAFGIKLGSDPTAFQIEGGRLYIFGDIIGHEMWKLDPAWNIRHGDALWPDMQDRGWRAQSLLPLRQQGRSLQERARADGRMEAPQPRQVTRLRPRRHGQQPLPEVTWLACGRRLWAACVGVSGLNVVRLRSGRSSSSCRLAVQAASDPRSSR